MRQQVVGNLFQVKKVPLRRFVHKSPQKGAGGTFLNHFFAVQRAKHATKTLTVSPTSLATDLRRLEFSRARGYRLA